MAGIDTTGLSAEQLREVSEQLRVQADRLESEGCTGVSASWCPVHGDCTCPEWENDKSDFACPLHSPQSSHAESNLAARYG